MVNEDNKPHGFGRAILGSCCFDGQYKNGVRHGYERRITTFGHWWQMEYKNGSGTKYNC